MEPQLTAANSELFKGKRVLVIEPDSRIQKSLSVVLKPFSFAQVTFVTSSCALETILKETPFDIVITAHDKSNVNCIYVLQLIRKKLKDLNTVVLLNASEQTESVVLEAMRNGVSEFLVAPFTFPALQERIVRGIAKPVKSEGLDPRLNANKDNSEPVPLPTILVVDDVPDNLKIITEILKSQYKVQAAINARAAMKVLSSDTPPDVVLLDIMMPQVDGLTLCKKIKSTSKLKNIPIIFITAMSSQEDVVRGLQLGAVDYITKPIKPEILKARIKAQFNIINNNKSLRTKTDMTVDYSILLKELDRVFQYDIKNSLNDISASVTKLLKSQENISEFLEEKANIECATLILTNYIQNLKLHKELKHSDYTASNTWIDIAKLANEVLESNQVLIKRNKVKVELKVDGDMRVKSSKMAFRHILNNLTLHALSTAETQSTLRILLTGDDDSINITVSNRWFPSVEQRISIFEPLVILADGRENAYARYIIKILSEVIGGHLEFDFDDTQGSSLNVELMRDAA